MPDITMCANKECLRYKVCYRAQAKPSERQSYGFFMGATDCEDFIPNAAWIRRESCKQ